MEIRMIEREKDLSVEIHCREITGKVRRLRDHIALFEGSLWGKEGDQKKQIPLNEILYFESVDDRTFAYTEGAVLEVGSRLYQLEESLPESDFFRCSKSMIVNLGRIESLKPELNRSLLATMAGGEKITISRRFVKPLVDKISGKEG